MSKADALCAEIADIQRGLQVNTVPAIKQGMGEQGTKRKRTHAGMARI
jgi:hypothetical protein